MRTIGSWLMRLVALTIGVVMWLVVPYMLHAQHQWLNALQLLAWAFGLLMVLLLMVGAVAVRKPIKLPRPPARPVAPAPGIMQPICEVCTTTPANVYSVSRDVLLCTKCATDTPGKYGTLYAVAYGQNARIIGSSGKPAVATNPAK